MIIAAVAGSLGQALAGYSLGGCLISAVVGFIGAFLGLWLSRQLGLPAPLTVTVDGEPFPILWSIIGSPPCWASSAAAGVQSDCPAHEKKDQGPAIYLKMAGPLFF